MAFHDNHPLMDVILYDASGNAITSIVDSEEPSERRLQTESRLAPGSTVNIGTGIPSDPSDLIIGFLTDDGTPTGSEDMLIDGDPTPVEFTFEADPTDDLALDQLLIVFSADDFEFDGASFGPNSPLTNGIKVETVISATTTEIFNIKQNEDFLRVPGRTPLVNNTGPKDIMAINFAFGGIVKLAGGSSDLIRITIRDDLTSVKLKYLTATMYAVKES